MERLSNEVYAGNLMNFALVWDPYGDAPVILGRPPVNPPPEPSEETAAAGWAAYDQIADAEGGLNLPQLSTILDKLLMKPATPWSDILDSVVCTIVSLAIILPVAQATGVSPSPEEVFEQTAKLSAKVKKSICSSFPVIYGSIFRFFDSNGNGTISRDEIIAFFNISKDPSYKAPKAFVESVFRALDEDASGVVEPIELADLATDLINGGSKFATSLLDTFEPEIKGPFKEAAVGLFDQAFQQAVMVLGENIKAGEGKLSIAGLAAQVVAMGPPDDFPMSPSDFLNANIPGEFRQVLDTILGVKESFRSKFGAADSLPKDRVVASAGEVIGEILDRFLNVPFINGALDMVGGPAGLFPPAATVPASQIADTISVAVGSTRAFLMGGGLRRLMAAVISLFDANNDGAITQAELFGVLDKFQAFSAATSVAEAKPIIGEFIAAVLGMFDADSDGALDAADLEKIIEKIIDIVFALAYLIVAAGKQVATALALPAVNIALSLKPMAIPGSSADSITASDMDFFFQNA